LCRLRHAHAPGFRRHFRVATKNIDRQTGRDFDEFVAISDPRPVEDGTLRVDVMGMKKFTTIEFERAD
jgi:hypothetical protein